MNIPFQKAVWNWVVEQNSSENLAEGHRRAITGWDFMMWSRQERAIYADKENDKKTWLPASSIGNVVTGSNFNTVEITNLHA